jgi:hypothetical protein
MTPQFATYEPPPSETEGDNWSLRTCAEREGQIVVKVLKYRTGVVTENSPDGTDEIRMDVVDLSDPTQQFVYRNVPTWTGAVVDGLKPYAGSADVLVLDTKMVKAKSGRRYPTIEPATDFSLAERFYASKGDPFAQQFSTVAGGVNSRNDDPPF